MPPSDRRPSSGRPTPGGRSSARSNRAGGSSEGRGRSDRPSSSSGRPPRRGSDDAGRGRDSRDSRGGRPEGGRSGGFRRDDAGGSGSGGARRGGAPRRDDRQGGYGSRDSGGRSGGPRSGDASGRRSGPPRRAQGEGGYRRDDEGRSGPGGVRRDADRRRSGPPRRDGGGDNPRRPGRTWRDDDRRGRGQEHRRDRRPDEVEGAPPSWGGVARRGAARLSEEGSASAAWRAANEAARETKRSTRPGEEGDEDTTLEQAIEEEPAWEPEQWIDEGEVRDEAAGAVRRGLEERPRPSRGARGGGRARRTGPPPGVAPAPPASLTDDQDDEVAAAEREREARAREASVDDELKAALGASRGARAESRMREAGDAFRRGRFEDARRILRPLAEQAPRVAALRELYGLTLYRLGRWKQATNELEAFRTISASVDQHPVLADSYRALGRYDDVETLWQELSAASPSSELMAEGRIVMAGALSDQGRVEEALRLLEPAVKPARRAKPHHLRVAYALADLYERAGDLPKARELFERVATSEPEFVDVQARIQALR